MKPIVTILTPTYNRKEKLKKLYNSLKLQEKKNFIWLVIDDGSTDGTELLFDEWKNESVFEIYYYKKENGGKHTALNYAYKYITTPLTFIVDSDDFITKDAISLIEKNFNKYKQQKDICGFSYLRGKPQGGLLSSSGIPQHVLKETYCECRINRNIKGDMAEVWVTEILKKFPFPEYEGEKFLGEDIVWVRMSGAYKMLFFNDIIYISDYLDDGLTRNRRRNNINSPNGCIERAETFLNAKIKYKYKVKSIIQYIIYGKFAERSIKDLYLKSNNKIMYIMFLPLAMIIYMKWKHDFFK